MNKLQATQYLFKEGPYVIVTLCKETGTVDIQSDYGDYQYRWQSIGDNSLEQFLAKLDHEYIASKFWLGKDKYFDIETTREKIIKDIQGCTMDNYMKAIWINNLPTDVKTAEAFYSLLDSKMISEVYGGDFSQVPYVSGTHPQLKQFMEKCWPRVVEEFKKEIYKNENVSIKD